MFTIEQHGSRVFGTVLAVLPITADTADDHAKRWREWQLKNEHTQRQGARRSRFAFTAIFLALAVWLGAQLVFSQVG